MTARNRAYVVLGVLAAQPLTGVSSPVAVQVNFTVLAPDGTVAVPPSGFVQGIDYGDNAQQVRVNIAAALRESQTEFSDLEVEFLGG